MTADRRPVRATYRLQLEPGALTLRDAGSLVPYLAELGVSHLYCSPLLEAVPGSPHGYDVADPTRVREELGGEGGLRQLADTAHDAGLGLIADIVPNHVGASPANPLWERLLSGGPDGPAARFFDVNWEPPLPGAAGKVVLPVLGEPYGAALHAGDLRLVDDGGLRLRYHEHTFPLSPATEEEARRAGGPEAFAGRPGEPATWNALHGLLEAQHYRLVWWRPGGRLVNYRRFFSIDELAAVRVELPEVFDHTHAKIIELVNDGVLDGLRIDHPDGLRDPARYLARLAERTGGAWTVVEKITARGEALPDWPVAGTTGYAFSNDVLGLFVEPEARPLLDALDLAFGGSGEPFGAVAAASKAEALEVELPGEADRLAGMLLAAAQEHREARDVTWPQCREVIARVAVALDVYRTYVAPETGTASDDDIVRIDSAVARAGDVLPGGTAAEAPAFLYRLLGDLLAGRVDHAGDALDLVARFQQLTAALEAKGIEDTALYRHRRLLAVNEVGGDPNQLGMSAEAFHHANMQRARRHPTGMLATSTHDTKRGEDVRLRIAALTELGERWPAAAGEWRKLNAGHVVGTPTGPAPDPSTELLIYQTLVGVLPADGSEPDEEVARRVLDYAVKACREAGVRTAHADPDVEFERGLAAFVEAVLDRQRSGAFLDALSPLVDDAAGIAMVAGLAQTLLRTTSPGVPDTYQGTELWDDSLVDPDNRRPVGFRRRADLFCRLDGEEPARLIDSWGDGRVKLWTLAQGLQVRRHWAEAYGEASGYVPLAVRGIWSEHVVAFARTAPDGSRGPVTVVPRLPGRVGGAGRLPVGEVWGDTVVVVPERLGGAWSDALSGAGHGGDRLPVGEVLGTLPVALLEPRA